MRKKFFALRLQRFADGGTDGGSEGASGVTSQDAAGSTGADSTQDAAAAAQETKVSFDELIKGEYKEDYDRAVQKIVRQRFAKAEKQAKANEEQLGKMAPIMQALASKYGVNADDIDSIAKYVNEDDAMYEDAALQAGMTVDQYKQYAHVMAENQRLIAERQANEQRRAMNEQVQRWRAEEQQIKTEFPDFDLDSLIQDESFNRMVQSGVPLRSAYIAMEADHILPAAMSYAAQQGAIKAQATIAQRGSRPVEGGMSGQAASKVATDVSKMSDAEIADMAARIMRGELTHL